MKRTPQRHNPRNYVPRLSGVLLAVTLVAAFGTALVGSSAAAPNTAPQNTGEPVITGTPRVGQVLRTTRGTWSGTTPMSFAFRWFRCDGAGAPDASDCQRISNAADNTYVARQADAGFRLRSQVTATNADGSAVATSNPTPVITAARPVNTSTPSISGSAVVGNTLSADRGTWGGNQPMTFAFVWLRCNDKGDNCSEISGADGTTYDVRDADTGHTIRVRVTARNDRGQASAVSSATGVVGGGQPAPGGSLAVEDLRASGDRLVVASVQFSPNPVTSSTAPITAHVRVTARQGTPVRGALVFMRGTPRVVQGQTQTTQADGTATLTLVPNQLFPQPRNGFNVQFFIKAFRRGDPGLGGIAGFRLVQVRLAGGA